MQDKVPQPCQQSSARALGATKHRVFPKREIELRVFGELGTFDMDVARRELGSERAELEPESILDKCKQK